AGMTRYRSTDGHPDALELAARPPDHESHALRVFDRPRLRPGRDLRDDPDPPGAVSALRDADPLAAGHARGRARDGGAEEEVRQGSPALQPGADEALQRARRESRGRMPAPRVADAAPHRPLQLAAPAGLRPRPATRKPLSWLVARHGRELPLRVHLQ